MSPTFHLMRKKAWKRERINDLDSAIAIYQQFVDSVSGAGKRRNLIAKRIARLELAKQIDAENVERFGPDAPRFAERIWVHPSEVRATIAGNDIVGIKGRDASAIVIDHWPADASRDDHHKRGKIGACYKHWVDGLSWEETGIYEMMMRRIQQSGGRKDNCSTLDDVKERYRKLDETFETIKAEGRIRTRNEIDRNWFREYFGVFVHLGPGGEPMFGGRAFHRFAIASILDLWMPCQIGVVHQSALPMMEKYRQAPY